ncbi:Crp/Fnr family transcriptional regulator [Sediminimonas sp.]|uniref:Crp/Fnr family transcriptional regulator n=1 Tax=Sediminimonas sp. TaxID=2823379 RepID=UPI0025CD428F|nr:Crp/Fnr family transcriptional regulator [Sediminimonas sp.]
MSSSEVETTPPGMVSRSECGVPFSDASVHLRRVLKAHMHGYRAETILKFEGEDSAAVYCVQTGWLAVSKSMANGARQIIDVILPGEIIDPYSANGHTSSVQIEALSYTTIAVVPRAVWSRLEDSDPELRHTETTTIAASLSRMSERMLRLGKGTAESRIAYAMIELCMRLGAIGECNNGAFHLPLTQQGLGDFVGLSAVHVCRTLRRLSRSGIISTEDHMDVVIHDLDALADVAGVDPERLRGEIIVTR